MSYRPHLSLPHAILINLNAMVGSGIFINTVVLAALAGVYSPLIYLVVGILILPLMLCFSHLAYLYPHGSLYTYSSTISTKAGIWSAWSYFHGKLASCAVAIHVAATLIKTSIGALQVPYGSDISLVAIDSGLLALFTLLNYYHLRTGKLLQLIFMVGKLVPIATIIIVGIWYPAAHGITTHTIAHSIAGIPLVLYAFMGFETSSGFTRSLLNAEKNSWRAMAAAFVGGLTITTLFQYCAYRAVPSIESLSSYFQLFPSLLAAGGITGHTATLLLTLLHGGIAASAAGVAYSILYANSGNLHELARRNLIRGSSFFAPINAYHVPARCLMVESGVVLIYLLFATAQLPFLQQMAAAGVVVTYAMSVRALARLYYNRGWLLRGIPAAGTASCLLLFAAMIRSGMLLGWMPYVLYLSMQLGGIALLTRSDAVETSDY